MQEEINLYKIEVYNLARDLSRECWKIYSTFDWHTKQIIGDQWITAVDSCGANIAEAHGRFHYLDKIRFLYNARGSLYEALHWLEVLGDRNMVSRTDVQRCNVMIQALAPKLNRFIETQYQHKENWRNSTNNRHTTESSKHPIA